MTGERPMTESSLLSAWLESTQRNNWKGNLTMAPASSSTAALFGQVIIIIIMHKLTYIHDQTRITNITQRKLYVSVMSQVTSAGWWKRTAHSTGKRFWSDSLTVSPGKPRFLSSGTRRSPAAYANWNSLGRSGLRTYAAWYLSNFGQQRIGQAYIACVLPSVKSTGPSWKIR